VQASRHSLIEDATSSLSLAAQDALVNALATLPAPEAYYPDEEQAARDRVLHEQFRNEMEGAELWHEWGREAPQKYATMRQRWNYIRDCLPEHERQEFDEIFCSMPPAAIVAAFRELAG
jgi:hypothetical protein